MQQGVGFAFAVYGRAAGYPEAQVGIETDSLCILLIDINSAGTQIAKGIGYQFSPYATSPAGGVDK